MHHLDYVPLVVEDGCKVRIMLVAVEDALRLNVLVEDGILDLGEEEVGLSKVQVALLQGTLTLKLLTYICV